MNAIKEKPKASIISLLEYLIICSAQNFKSFSERLEGHKIHN